MKKLLLLLLCITAGGTLRAQDYQVFEGAPDRFGLKDAQGKVIVPAIYGFVSGIFKDGFSWVMKDGKIGFVNAQGRLITPLKYDAMFDFNNGFARVNTGAEWDDDFEPHGGKWGVINRSGKEITPIKYDDISGISKAGFAFAMLNGKWGIIDTTGKERTAFKYDFMKVSEADSTLAVVNIGGTYDEAFGPFLFNSYVGGKQGFVHCLTGKEVIPPVYANVTDFSEGLAAVNMGAVFTAGKYTGGKWGFVDNTGKVVIPLQYERAGYFHNGRAEVQLGGKTVMIDKTGTVVTKN